MIKKVIYIILLIIILSFTEQISLSNEISDITLLMKAKIESARIRVYPPEIKITDEQLKEVDPYKIMEILEPYETDPCDMVRRFTYNYEVKIAKMHKQTQISQKVTSCLLAAMLDPNSDVRPKPYELLLTFTKNDFSDKSKEILHNALVQERPSKEVILICGVADMKDELPRLEELKQSFFGDSSTKWYYTKSFRTRLAKARIGDKKEIEVCVNSIENEIDKNDTFLLLDRLGYIRQPEAITILKKYLDSKRMLPYAGDDVLRESYASYVMDILIESLEDFPIEKKPGRGYKSVQIKEARKWMSKKKNWKIIR